MMPWLRSALLLSILLSGLAVPAVAQEEADPLIDDLPTARPNDLLDPKAKTEQEKPEKRAASSSPDEDAEPPVWQMLLQDEEEHAACIEGLRSYGMSFRETEPIADEENADCGIGRPVEVETVVPGVDLLPPASLHCKTALALAEWVSSFALPASLKLRDRGPLTGIEQGSGYVCRKRNNGSDTRVSEHSFGNAIDVMAFRFASGDPIPVEPRMREGTMAEAYQRAVRASACMNFTTVLGPGTDEAHADHLHLDIKQRRGGFRLCQ